MNARRRKPKGPAPGEWQYTVGEVPHRLTAYERPQKGMRIYTRLWNGRRYTERRALCDPIRDERGEIDPEREIAAQRATLERHQALTAGLDGEAAAGPLTLRTGFRRLLDPAEGKYAGRTDYVGDVKRNADVVLRILGADLRWSQLKHAHYRKLWRTLAQEHQKTGAHGPRQAEVICGVLQSAARWLGLEGHIEPGTALPAPGWNQTMRREWAEITDTPQRAPAKPRYTPAESERLWAALTDERVDPRLWLAMEIGAELRLGQVPRSHRSDVEPLNGYPLGMVRVHGKGKKHGELVVLTPEQRAALYYAMSHGYLRGYEAAYQAGEVEDYPLIPGGRLRQWIKGRKREEPVAQRKDLDTPLGKTALAKWWKRLEEVAGVKHQPGRRWYGMRRLQTDRAEDVEQDSRVLNRMGGWTSSETRRKYQESGRVEINQRAAEVRRKIRPGKPLGGETEGDPK